ncbi:MAG: cytidylate kinase-like family protein [Oscillospiraceae bacterium]|nr:cytidylate kinase-like family protein [Oscillospiraceae bacterium]
MKKTIVTIGRQYGSGGREVGRRLAQRLGVPFYDKNLIDLAAKESGIDPKIFEQVDETAASSLLYGLSMGNYMMGDAMGGGSFVTPINDKVFFAEADRIVKAAQEGPCVIVGRCADYILRKRGDVLPAFIYASLQDRIDRAVREYGADPVRAKDAVHKTDKRRANFYNYYSSFSRKWGDLEHYSIALSTSAMNLDMAARLLELLVRES